MRGDVSEQMTEQTTGQTTGQSRDIEDVVVVGVDGTEQGLLAVRYAVAEARRTGCTVRLVHAVPEVIPMAPMMPMVGMETLVEAGRGIIGDARRVADEAFGGPGGGGSVEEVLRGGSRVHLLVEASATAREVVLGRRERTGLSRIFLGSTSSAVATRAHAPVVTVPSAWSPERVTGEVVVGVEDPTHTSAALTRGFEEADRRGARLTVLHTWRLPGPYDHTPTARVYQAQWRETVAAELESVLKGLRDEYPGVEVLLDLRHQHPAAALVGASEGADLLVLGRNGRGAPFGRYLGSVARTLLHEARCPVVVTPERG